MDNQIIAMLLGIAGSLFLHLSKGLQRLGIDFLDRKNWGQGTSFTTFKNGTIYIIGILMNYSYSLWMITAVHFAPASSFTSMYSVGVLGLLVFSKYILKEHVGKYNFIGNIIIVLGAILLAFENSTRGVIDPGGIDVSMVVFFSVLFLIISVILIIVAIKFKNPIWLGFVLGLFTGGISAIDPVLKSISLHIGSSVEYLPTTGVGWIFFWSSFLCITLSFWGTQFGFARKVPASILVTMNSLFYSLLPIIIQLTALPGYDMLPLTLAGLCFIVMGGLIASYPSNRKA